MIRAFIIFLLSVSTALSAEVKISDLPETNAPSASAVLPIVDAGVTWKVTKGNLIGSSFDPAYFGTNVLPITLVAPWITQNGFTLLSVATNNVVVDSSGNLFVGPNAYLTTTINQGAGTFGVFTTNYTVVQIGAGMNGPFTNGSAFIAQCSTNGGYYQFGCDNDQFFGPFISIEMAQADPGGNFFGTTNIVCDFFINEQDSANNGGSFYFNPGKTASEFHRKAMIWAYPSNDYGLAPLFKLTGSFLAGYPDIFEVRTNGNVNTVGTVAATTGFSSSATDSSAITTTGITNSFGKLASVYLDATGAGTYTLANGSGTLYRTNKVLVNQTSFCILQAGDRLVVGTATGVTGTIKGL